MGHPLTNFVKWALCNISFHCAHDKITLRENLTIESWGTGNYMTCRTPPSLFRLFANATHKINHARRNFTFTCKITPRVNFYMFRTLNDTLYRSSFLRLLLRSIVSDNCMIVSCDEKLSKIVAGVNS